MSKFGDWLKNLFGFSVGGSSDNNNNSDTLTLPGSDKPFGWDVPVIDDGSDSQPQSGFGVNFGYNIDSSGSSGSGLNSFFKSLTQLVPAFLNRLTAEHLTGAEREANAFSAEQSQINRDFEERMASTQYQRGVTDMKAAGVNPALAIGQGGAVAPSGQAASSVNPQGSAFNLGDVFQLMMMKPQIELMKKQGAAMEKQSDAALAGAEASKIAAGAQARQAETSSERLHTVEQPLANSQIAIAGSVVSLNAKSVEKMDKEIAQLDEDISLTQLHEMASSLDIIWKAQTWAENKRLLVAQIGKTISASALDYAMRSKALSEKDLADLQKDINQKDKFINDAIVDFLKAQPGTGWIQNEINKGSSWQSLLHGYGTGIIDAIEPSDFNFTKPNFISDHVARGIVDLASRKNRH